MSTTSIFKNLYGEVIRFQQAIDSNADFDEEIYENLELKRIMHYDENQNLEDVSFYLGLGDDLSAIIHQASKKYGGGYFYFDKQTVNGFTVWQYEGYKNLVLKSKASFILDNKGRKVAYQRLDIHTQTIIDTYKYCYMSSLGEFETHVKVPFHGRFDFSYHPDYIFVDLNLSYYMDVGGGGFNITPNKNIFLEDNELASIFNWNDHPYYHSAEPLIPTTPNI